MNVKFFRQICFGDILLLNKIDLVSDEELLKVEGKIRYVQLILHYLYSSAVIIALLFYILIFQNCWSLPTQ